MRLEAKKSIDFERNVFNKEQSKTTEKPWGQKFNYGCVHLLIITVLSSLIKCLIKCLEIRQLKCILFYFDMLITFCFGVSSNLSQEKSPTVEILGKYFL